MKRHISFGNEAHRAAAISDVFVSAHAQLQDNSDCTNPKCILHRSRFRRYRIITTVVMAGATIAGIVSFAAGQYVMTVLSLVLGNASHAIDVWLLDAAKDAYMSTRRFWRAH